MAAKTAWKSSVRTVLAGLVLFHAIAGQAQSGEDLDARAVAEYNRALDASDAGQYEDACQGFRNAAILYENSIGSLYSWPMRTEEDRQLVKDAANRQQASADGARRHAKDVCGLKNGPPPQVGSAGGAPGGDDLDDQMLDLQRSVTLAKRQYDDAMSKYEAHDFAGACTSSRLAADGLARAATAMRNTPALEAAFANPGQVYADAALAAEVRDDTFCAR